MASKFCVEELSEQLSLVDSHRSFIEAFCILNLTFALIAALENLLVFHALWKSSTIPATVKKLFLSLVVSDFVAEILAQPMYGVIIAVMLKKTSNDQSIASFCPTILNLCYFLLVLLCSASFLTITAIAVDRLLSISLHLRYRELVTPKRVIIVLMALWLTSGTTGSLFIILREHSNAVTAIVESIGLCLNTVAYIRIYRAVRYHENRIQCQLQVQNSNSSIDLLRQRKSSLNALVVYLVFLVCYLRYIFTIILLLVLDSEDTSLLLAERASLILIFLNSSINPLVYCWRYREIRDSVKSTLKKLFLHERELDRRE